MEKGGADLSFPSCCHFSISLHLPSPCCLWSFQDQGLGTRHNRKISKTASFVGGLFTTVAEQRLSVMWEYHCMANSALNWCGWIDHWYRRYLLCKTKQLPPSSSSAAVHWSSWWTPDVNILGMRVWPQVPVFTSVSALLELLGVSHKHSLTLCSNGSTEQPSNLCTLCTLAYVLLGLRVQPSSRGHVKCLCFSLTDSYQFGCEGGNTLKFGNIIAPWILTEALQLVNIMLTNL